MPRARSQDSYFKYLLALALVRTGDEVVHVLQTY